ncbi:hypothetical protein L1987_76427 [Smallanthus sonchifolius]|uniref:Uncharacterized protein n=1 Tax=Smallanthus sonchifolius TaxID=185202 RepID=A0ACB9A7H9_9ASTR|nr:hypothetical protein L1987_76427 [Smallanthus sonchifolius]
MPRKKDPPPSTLPPHRSARGASKSYSLIDGEDAESLMVPLVGLGDTQEGSEDLQQPSLLTSGSNLCNINKEISNVPSVTVSLDESDHDLESIKKENFLKNSAAAGMLLAGKPGFAGNLTGLSDSDSSGSPGTDALHTGSGTTPSSVSATGGVGCTGPSATPLFSPEFKAMWGRDYPRPSTVFSSPIPMSAEVALSPTVSVGENVSQLPDMHVHVPGVELETEFEVHAMEENHLGHDSVEGIHGSHGEYGEVGDEGFHGLNREEGLHAPSNVVHGGIDEVPLQPIEAAKVAPDGGDGINVVLADEGVGVMNAGAGLE